MNQLLIGFTAATIIALLAHRANSLSRTGTQAAIVVGTVIFGYGGWQWALLLLTFFITSTVLTRAFKKRKAGLNEKFSKGGQRDAGQVLGNGGVAALFAALNHFYPNQPWVWVGFAAALAAVNADTWATELGVLNPHPPRMINNPRIVVEKGTSGGISLGGTLASLAGASLVAVLAVVFPPYPIPWTAGFIIALAGLGGSLFDSFLGATIQAIYHCPACNKETERHPRHTCGTLTKQIRGWAWLSNDWVNFGCGAFGTLLAIIFWLV